MSRVLCHVFCVTCFVSRVLCHVLCVMCVVSRAFLTCFVTYFYRNVEIESAEVFCLVNFVEYSLWSPTQSM